MVTDQLDPIIEISISGPKGAQVQLHALVDTGFNHELTLPSNVIRELNLELAMPIQATLAGDVRLIVNLFRAVLSWDDRPREVAVLEMEGIPLVGMSLLLGHLLRVHAVPKGGVSIEPATSIS